jgi:hypothetical protein
MLSVLTAVLVMAPYCASQARGHKLNREIIPSLKILAGELEWAQHNETDIVQHDQFLFNMPDYAATAHSTLALAPSQAFSLLRSSTPVLWIISLILSSASAWLALAAKSRTKRIEEAALAEDELPSYTSVPRQHVFPVLAANLLLTAFILLVCGAINMASSQVQQYDD